jgi:putative peptidoglycan lipid II flippase
VIRRPYFLKVLTLTASTRFLGALKDIWLASYFARSLEIEVCFLALLVPYFIANVVGGSLRNSFVPEFYRIQNTGSEPAINEYTFNALKFASMMGLTLCLPCYFLGQWLFPVMRSEENLSILLLLSLLPLPLLISSALEGFLIAKKKSPALISISAIGPLLIITILSVGGASPRLLVDVTLAASFVEMLCIGWLALRSGLNLRPQLRLNFAVLNKLFKQFTSLLGGSTLQSSMEIIDKGMAAYLVVGSVAALHYGTKITLAITAILAGAMTQVFLPAFSELIANKEYGKLRSYFWRLNLQVFFASTILVGLLIWRPETIINLVFGYGNFKVEDVRIVADVHQFFVLQIPFYLSGLIGVWVLLALQKNSWLTYIAMISFVANAAGNWILMQKMGVAGISLSTSIVYFISWGLILLVAEQKMREAREDSR